MPELILGALVLALILFVQIVDGGSSRNSRIFPLAEHEKSKPFQGFHRAVKPKAVG